MTMIPEHSGPDATDSKRDDATLMGLIRVLYRWRRMILGLAGTLTVATAVGMFLTPNQFTAKGTILLEVAENGTAGDLLGQLSMFTGGSSQTPAGEIYLAILQSERVGRAIVEQLDLVETFEVEGASPEERMELALAQLRQKVRFINTERVVLRINAKDTDPELAAGLVNAYLDELLAANQGMSLSRSHRTREMVEVALADAEQELEDIRGRLREFQREYGAFSLDDQTRATLALIAQLQAELMTAETEKAALSGFRRNDASGLQNIDLQISALTGQIASLVGDMSGEGAASNRSPKNSESYLLSLAEIPDLTEAYTRIVMDLEVQQAKYTVLATKLEQTKIEESQSVPSFEILDRAERPFRKSGPNRKIFVLSALFAGLLAGILLAILLDDLSRRVDDTTRTELRAMLPGLLSRS